MKKQRENTEGIEHGDLVVNVWKIGIFGVSIRLLQSFMDLFKKITYKLIEWIIFVQSKLIILLKVT